MPDHRERLARTADEDLMALAADADDQAFAVVYDRHCDAAFALAHRICGSRAAADDACQDAFMDAWRSAGRYDARAGSVRSWLLTIVHHRAIDHVRRMTRTRDRTGGDEEAAAHLPARADTQADALARAERTGILGMLGTLGEEERRIVGLAFYSGYSHSEIAAILGLPLGTVKTRMRTSLARLRDHLDGAPA